MLKTKIAVLLASLMTVSSFGTTAYADEPEVTLDAVIGNEISNGTFENNTEGWDTSGNTKIEKTTAYTHDDSAGSALIHQSKIAPASTYFPLRNNQTYYARAYVKPTEATDNATAKITVKVGNTDLTASVEPTVVNGETLLETTFVNTSSDQESLTKQAELYIDFSGNVDFYLDDVYVEKVSDFSVLSAVTEEIDRLEVLDNGLTLTDVIDSGHFPDTARAAKTADTDKCVSPEIYVAMNQGKENQRKEYVISCWYKVPDDYGGKIVLTGVSPYEPDVLCTLYEEDAPTDRKWHHISFSYIEKRRTADLKLSLSLLNEGETVTRDTYGEGRTLLVADLSALESIVARPELTLWEDGATDTALTKISDAGWTINAADSDVLTGAGVDVATYDNSAKLAYLKTNPDGSATVDQMKVNAVQGTKYRVGAWVMLDSNSQASEPKAYMSSSTGRSSYLTENEKKPDELEYTSLTAGEWIWIEYPYIIKESIAASHVRLNIKGTESGDRVYFAGFTVEECVEVNLTEISDITLESAVAGNTNTSTVTTTASALRYLYLVADEEDSENWTIFESGHKSDVPDIFIPESYAGKYIKIKAYPMNSDGSFGVFGETDPVLIENAFSVEEVVPTLGEDTVTTAVTIKNNSTGEKNIAVIAAFYNSNNEMVAAKVDNQTVVANGEGNFEVVVDITAAEYSDMRLYVVEGAADDATGLSLCPLTLVN